ncbi:hypothetical protein GCM10022279_07840 [Comamonas faecalis]|uniref:N6 adenine-specific DNA methyltransferase N-terminal domain-containing protein n=1 Tax=Comamonas faecalis TaxID=1387849 RepID=A0ABP7QT62_9BURK
MTDTQAPNPDLAYADTLWKAADTLRGQIDAAEYKHVVLGLLFRACPNFCVNGSDFN